MVGDRANHAPLLQDHRRCAPEDGGEVRRVRPRSQGHDLVCMDGHMKGFCVGRGEVGEGMGRVGGGEQRGERRGSTHKMTQLSINKFIPGSNLSKNVRTGVAQVGDMYGMYIRRIGAVMYRMVVGLLLY